MSQTDTIEIGVPDDFHLHVRDGEMLRTITPFSAVRFGRAIIMPNLTPPVTDTEKALAYRERILAALPEKCSFTPLMTLYMTDGLSGDEIKKAQASGMVYAVKLYPAGATTNSQFGVTDVKKVYPTLQVMADVGMPLLVHSEVTDPAVDVFDREAVFIEEILRPLVSSFPTLKVVVEHVTTKQGVEFVKSCPANVGATITVQHLLYNRNALFQGGLQPHNYCLPVLKSEEHRLSLVSAATSGSKKFFLGTDSAPHAKSKKECDCACAGCFTGFAAVEMYAQIFDKIGGLEHFEAFTSINGAEFYGLPRNDGKLVLRRRPWTVPAKIKSESGEDVVPFLANQTVDWQIDNLNYNF